MRLIPVATTFEDIEAYEALVCGGMSPDDVHSPQHFAKMVKTGALLAWWAVEDNEKIGWCALAPNHGKCAPGAWHLYGVWVRPDRRQKGIAKALWRYRIGLVPQGVPISVSIQPGKVGSERLAQEFGFSRIDFDDPPWDTYVLHAR